MIYCTVECGVKIFGNYKDFKYNAKIYKIHEYEYIEQIGDEVSLLSSKYISHIKIPILSKRYKTPNEVASKYPMSSSYGFIIPVHNYNDYDKYEIKIVKGSPEEIFFNLSTLCSSISDYDNPPKFVSLEIVNSKPSVY